MRTPDICIIGAGLFGSMTAKLLRSLDFDVLLVDSNEPQAASKCSFGLWRDGWISKELREKVDTSLEIIREFVEIKQINLFDVDKNAESLFYKIDVSQILNEQTMFGKVVALSDDKIIVSPNDKPLQQVEIAPKIATFVCAGVFTTEVLVLAGIRFDSIDSYWGQVLEFSSDAELEHQAIQTWAPYKQAVLLQEKDVILFSDGSAVKNIGFDIKGNPKDPRVLKVQERLPKNLQQLLINDGANLHLKLKQVGERQGLRPYLKKGVSDYVTKHTDKIYSATGGAKNSTVLCGYIALKLVEQVVK